jgi:hypothetical protein
MSALLQHPKSCRTGRMRGRGPDPIEVSATRLSVIGPETPLDPQTHCLRASEAYAVRQIYAVQIRSGLLKK